MIGEKEEERSDNCSSRASFGLASLVLQLTSFHYSLCSSRHSNFTRFLLLSRQSVTNLLSKKTPAKTSVVFTLPESPGALYKALGEIAHLSSREEPLGRRFAPRLCLTPLSLASLATSSPPLAPRSVLLSP